MKFVAVDYGQKRSGIAASDQGGSMAFPRTTLHKDEKSGKERFWADLLALLEKEQAEAIVVGLPIPDDGEENLTTRQVRNFTTSLKRRVNIPVFFMPETLSSFEGDQSLRAAGLFSRDIEKFSDQAAAVRILESFLDLPESRRILA